MSEDDLEWGLSTPTVVEHIGRTLRVTSPGGFFGGVTESNIITHPSQSRNPALTQLLADLRVAEREGIGVDRMVREMIRVGHQPPVIREVAGPFVQTALVGDSFDAAWVTWLGQLDPPKEAGDVSVLLILRRLVEHGWVDETMAAPLIQLGPEETRGVLRKLGRVTVSQRPLLDIVEGTPAGTVAAWRLGAGALRELLGLDEVSGQRRTLPTRSQVAVEYARARGRISSTELASLVGAAPSNVGAVLKALVAEGYLTPVTAVGRGRGSFYVWTGPPGSAAS